MKKILAFLKECGGKAVIGVIGKIADAAKAVAEVMKGTLKSKERKQLQKAEDRLDDACDSGNLQDLIDAAEKLKRLKKTIAAITCALICVGCESLTVSVVKPYEGRYDSKEKLVDAVMRIDLKRGESVWILTPDTLKRLLKTTER